MKTWNGVRIEDIRPTGPLPHASSVNGRVAGATLGAVDEETMQLVVLGVKRSRSPVPA